MGYDALRDDGEGRRVRKLTASETITYVYDAFGRLAAEYSSQAPEGAGRRYFRTTDHLGSTRLVTDGSGAVVSRRDYFPFGEEIPANATFNDRHLITDGQAQTTYNRSSGFAQKFTGKERDGESGLDYFGARYYAASLGRFTGSDAPFTDQNPASPQSWNLYAYVRNNPLASVDDDGRQTRVVTVATKVEHVFRVVQSFDPAELVMSLHGFRSNVPRNEVLRGRRQFEYPVQDGGAGFPLAQRAQVIPRAFDANASFLGDVGDAPTRTVLVVERSNRVTIGRLEPDQVIGAPNEFIRPQTVSVETVPAVLRQMSMGQLRGVADAARVTGDRAIGNVVGLAVERELRRRTEFQARCAEQGDCE